MINILLVLSITVFFGKNKLDSSHVHRVVVIVVVTLPCMHTITFHTAYFAHLSYILSVNNFDFDSTYSNDTNYLTIFSALRNRKQKF
jgi:hypothetical protein